MNRERKRKREKAQQGTLVLSFFLCRQHTHVTAIYGMSQKMLILGDTSWKQKLKQLLYHTEVKPKFRDNKIETLCLNLILK